MRNKAEIELYTKDMMEALEITRKKNTSEEIVFFGNLIIRDCQKKVSQAIKKSQISSPAMTYLYKRWK